MELIEYEQVSRPLAAVAQELEGAHHRDVEPREAVAQRVVAEDVGVGCDDHAAGAELEPHHARLLPLLAVFGGPLDREEGAHLRRWRRGPVEREHLRRQAEPKGDPRIAVLRRAGRGVGFDRERGAACSDHQMQRVPQRRHARSERDECRAAGTHMLQQRVHLGRSQRDHGRQHRLDAPWVGLECAEQPAFRAPAESLGQIVEQPCPQRRRRERREARVATPRAARRRREQCGDEGEPRHRREDDRRTDPPGLRGRHAARSRVSSGRASASSAAYSSALQRCAS